MEICSIASGSSGNCIYVGNENTHILVDAGVSGKKIQNGLNEIGVSLNDIDAVLVTHEHIDHVGGLGVISRKCHMPIYCTKKTKEAILNIKSLGKVDENLFCYVSPDQNFNIGDIEVEPSATWHDAIDPVCYSFFEEDKKISIATDLGDFDEYLLDKLKQTNVLFVEANHDVRMLEAGPYPYPLKRRILGKRGHLSNERSGELILNLVKDGLNEIILGHLSKENNFPDLAYETVRSVLIEHKIDMDSIHLQVAQRDGCSSMVTL